MRRKLVVNEMPDEQGLLRKFDAFCKRVISNERKKYDRASGNRKKYEVLYVISELQLWPMEEFDADALVVCAGKRQAKLYSEELQSALNALSEHHREALILRFWLDWNDNRIASYFASCHGRYANGGSQTWRNSAAILKGALLLRPLP